MSLVTDNSTQSGSAGDTIAAISTAPGRGGIGVVRVSGPRAYQIAREITRLEFTPGNFTYCHFRDTDNSILDKGVVLYFKSPHSYTGEDVVEFQGHGGPAILQILLERVVVEHARLAKPGEFTERAFLNDKLDLAQAEAVSDLINSVNAAAAKAAMRSLNGALSSQVHNIRQQLIDLRVYVEASLDFSDEEIDFLSNQEMAQRTSRLTQTLSQTLQDAQQGQLLQEGLTLVLAGATNVGKSTLLNRLTGEDSAIVTDVAGTTRDIMRAHIQIDGLPLHILDTAGIRDSSDIVEQEGIRRTRAAVRSADRILLVKAYGEEFDEAVLADFPDNIPIDIVWNKIDQHDLPASVSDNKGDSTEIYLSAHTGDGIELLKNHLKKSVGYQQDNNSIFLARARHVESLEQASDAVQRALAHLQPGGIPDLCAEELRLAQISLNQITGEFSADDLLGHIFAGFCIGK